MWQKFILGVPIDRLVKQYPLLNKKTMPSSIMKLGKRLREFMEYKENNAFELSKNNVLYIDETTHPLTYSPQKSDGKTRYASYIYYGPNNTKANLSTIKDAATREILAYKVSKNLYIYIYTSY